MAEAKIVWILSKLFGTTSLCYTILNFLNIQIGQIEFAQLHEPFKSILVTIGIFYAVAQTAIIWVKLRSRHLEFKEKLFDFDIKKHAGKAIISTVLPEKNTVFSNSLPFLNRLSVLIDNLCARSKADRFLILSASNGKTPYEFLTVILEQHKGQQPTPLNSAANKFKNFTFDEEYLSILQQLKAKGSVDIVVETMPPCNLKTIYQNDKITQSLLYFIHSFTQPDGKAFLYYASVVTYNGLYTDDEKITISRYISEIKEQYQNQ